MTPGVALWHNTKKARKIAAEMRQAATGNFPDMPDDPQKPASGEPKAVHSTVQSTARVRRLMDHWEEECEKGNILSAEVLCADDMDIIDRVRDQIESLKSMTSIMFQMGSPEPAVNLAQTVTMPDLPPTIATGYSDVDMVAAEGLGLITEANRKRVMENPRMLIGRYHLESFLAQGGHGQVWRGFDPELQRRVAIKITRPERMNRLSAQQKYVEQYRFLEEARKAARLNHPGIVTIYDVGVEENLAFIVCELVEGEDLAQLLRVRKPTFAESVRMCIDIAEILQVAHDEGFIHRDIKPANILIKKTGQLVISDFGIAATLEDMDRENGTVVGTPSYMSPEQALGRRDQFGPGMDLYSLGVILFELLTGKLPFEHENTNQLLQMIVEKAPPLPTSIDPLIPSALERVCLKALSKSPDDRAKSGQEFADSLRYAALISGITID
jgi:tRNA A-37 threonylcarbamoyl transferase component Bud32